MLKIVKYWLVAVCLLACLCFVFPFLPGKLTGSRSLVPGVSIGKPDVNILDLPGVILSDYLHPIYKFADLYWMLDIRSENDTITKIQLTSLNPWSNEKWLPSPEMARVFINEGAQYLRSQYGEPISCDNPSAKVNDYVYRMYSASLAVEDIKLLYSALYWATADGVVCLWVEGFLAQGGLYAVNIQMAKDLGSISSVI